MALSILDIFEKPQMEGNEIFKNHPVIILSLITLLAATIRLYFFTGLTFSDDGYYDQLGYMFLKGENIRNFIGYPIFILRKLDTVFTAISYYIFGTNEVASVLPELLFSIANIIVIYFIALELSLNKFIALLSAFLLSFFPVDIFFATLHFTDLPASFFINSGVYLLLKSYRTGSILHVVSSGVLFLVSFFIKESAIFILSLILIIWIYFIVFRKINLVQIPVTLLIFIAGIIAESVYYGLTQGDYFFRFTMQNRNYIQCYYNFFPYVRDVHTIELSEYMKRLSKFLLENTVRFVFLRRYYLFTPLIAAVQSIILFKEHKESKLITWFAGLILLAIFMTTSLTYYRPLELRSNWYVYIFLIPTLLLTSVFINRLKAKYKIVAIVLYITGSLLMVKGYSTFFELDKYKEIKHFVWMNNTKVIYADHHNKYNIDLTLAYGDPSKVKIYTGSSFNFDNVKSGELVFIKPATIFELEQEGYKFADMSELKSDRFKLLFNNKMAQVYEKK
jgi:Dolichyl-phosphate-mannose-protein mannosyltransferase